MAPTVVFIITLKLKQHLEKYFTLSNLDQNVLASDSKEVEQKFNAEGGGQTTLLMSLFEKVN